MIKMKIIFINCLIMRQSDLCSSAGEKQSKKEKEGKADGKSNTWQDCVICDNQYQKMWRMFFVRPLHNYNI